MVTCIYLLQIVETHSFDVFIIIIIRLVCIDIIFYFRIKVILSLAIWVFFLHLSNRSLNLKDVVTSYLVEDEASFALGY